MIHIVLFLINGFLKDFEASQPKHVAEEVFKTYFSDFSASRYLDICEDSTAKYELRENLITYLDALTKDEKITYYSVSTGMDDGLQYVVRAGDTKFASFTLEKDIGDKESRFTRYKPGRFALYTDAKTKVDVEIPTGYTLYLNGVEVSHEYIIQEGIETPSCAHMPQDVAGTTLEKYKVAGFIQPPAVEVYSPNGQKALVEEGNNGAYKASVVADPQLADQYSSWFIEAATKYAIYMQYDSKVAALRRILIQIPSCMKISAQLKTALSLNTSGMKSKTKKPLILFDTMKTPFLAVLPLPIYYIEGVWMITSII